MCQKLPMVLLKSYSVPGAVQSISKTIMCVRLCRALLTNYSEQSMMVHACNPALWKLRQESMCIQGQPWLHIEYQATV